MCCKETPLSPHTQMRGKEKYLSADVSMLSVYPPKQTEHSFVNLKEVVLMYHSIASIRLLEYFNSLHYATLILLRVLFLSLSDGFPDQPYSSICSASLRFKAQRRLYKNKDNINNNKLQDLDIPKLIC
jgi:hypothetical protein